MQNYAQWKSFLRYLATGEQHFNAGKYLICASQATSLRSVHLQVMKVVNTTDLEPL